MIRKITIITLCLASLVPATVNAQAGNLNSSLRGDYSFSGEQTCIGSGTGFSGFDAQPPAYSTSASVESIHRFNGDGTGTAVGGRQVSINNNGGNTTVLGPASVSTFSLEFTYTVALDHSIHIANGPTATTQIVGPRAGTQEATIISTGTSYDGYVAEDFRTITVMTAAPNPLNPQLALEFLRYTSSAPGQIDFTQTCHRSRFGVRISGGSGQNSPQSTWPFSGH